MVTVTRRDRFYRGELIRECEQAPGEHKGRWIIQRYHSSYTYADELCPHYPTLAVTRAAIDETLLMGTIFGRHPSVFHA